MTPEEIKNKQRKQASAGRLGITKTDMSGTGANSNTQPFGKALDNPPSINSPIVQADTTPLNSQSPATKVGVLPSNFKPIDLSNSTSRQGILGSNFVSADGTDVSTFDVSTTPNSSRQSLSINSIQPDGTVKTQSGIVSNNVAESLGRGKGSFSVMQISPGRTTKDILESKLRMAAIDDNPFLINAYAKRLNAINQTENQRLGKSPSQLDIQKAQEQSIKNVMQLRKQDNDLLQTLTKKDPTLGKPLFDITTASDQILRRFKGRPVPLPTFKSILNTYGIDVTGSNDSLVDAARANPNIPQPLIEKLQESIASQQ